MSRKLIAAIRASSADHANLQNKYNRLNTRYLNAQETLEAASRLQRELNSARSEAATAQRELETLRKDVEVAQRLSRLTTPPMDEERTIVLTVGGETKLSITREEPGQLVTMDLLERSVRMIEDFMILPFPERRYGANHVDLRFIDQANCEDYQGQFRGTHMVICMDENTNSRGDLLRIITHETAHYYWNAGHHPPWLEEGAAMFLEYIVQGDLNPVFSDVQQHRCEIADTIEEFLGLPEPEDVLTGDYGGCVYGLGSSSSTRSTTASGTRLSVWAFAPLQAHSRGWRIPNGGGYSRRLYRSW